MLTLPCVARTVAVAGLLLMARGAGADIKVDVKQDPATKLWRYAYTVQYDDAIKAMGPGDIEEVELTTRDLVGADVPLMTLLPEGWSANWDMDDEKKPLLDWGNVNEKFELKAGGAPATFVLFSTRAPGDAQLVLRDEADNEAEFTVQGPTGE